MITTASEARQNSLNSIDIELFNKILSDINDASNNGKMYLQYKSIDLKDNIVLKLKQLGFNVKLGFILIDLDRDFKYYTISWDMENLSFA